MSPEVSGPAQQRLLPTAVEARMFGLFGRGLGGLVLVAVALCWVALLSWSVDDPSLTHATGGRTQNWVGPLGAIVSDLLLQMLGFAAMFMLLAPMFWGLELVLREHIKDLRSKATLFPLSVLLLAGGFSALPSAARWPLRHGYGGVLGDLLFSLASGAVGIINHERAGAIAGLVFFAAGFAAATRSLGHDLADLLDLVKQRAARPSAAGQHPTIRFTAPGLLGSLLARWRKPPETTGEAHPGFGPAEGSPVWTTHEPFQPAAAFPGPADDPHHVEPHLPGDFGTRRQAPATYSEPPTAPEDRDPSTRGNTFDHFTEAASRAIAERFAPPASGPVPRPAPADPARPSIAAPPYAPEQPSGPRMPRFLTAFSREQPAYKRPSLNALKRPRPGKPGPEFTQAVLRGNARLLQDALAEFGIEGAIKDIKPGPVVTLFELEPARGTKAARVIGLADDIARAMSTSAARVALLPGSASIGIELPNSRRETVLLREILDCDAWRTSGGVLPLALGKGIDGTPVVYDLARMPHLLVAGATGSGNTVGINAMLMSLLFKTTPDECRLLLIDPRMLELSPFNGIPHLLAPVITDARQGVAALDWVVAEMDERIKRMSRLGVRNIDVYNNRVRNAQKRGEMLARTVQTGFDAATGQAIYEAEPMAPEPMPTLVVVIAELADLMIAAGREVEAALQRLAESSRATGIHLIAATQRPTVDILTGTVKASLPVRLCYKTASRIDSRSVLDEQGAEQLLGQGDTLLWTGPGQMMRVHGPFVADEEVEAVIRHLREQSEPSFVEGLGPPPI